MDIEEKMGLVKRPPTEEVVTEQDLRALFEREPHPKHYIGLEVSGILNLGSLVINGFKVNDFIKAGHELHGLPGRLAQLHQQQVGRGLGEDQEGRPGSTTPTRSRSSARASR